MATHRSYIESERYANEKAIIEPDPAKWEAVEALFGWAIASSPEAYPIVDQARQRRRLRTRAGAVAGIPALNLDFSLIDQDHCQLESVRIATEPPAIRSFFDT